MYFATVVCPTSIPSESFYTLREAQIRPHASLGYSAIQSSCVAVFLFDQLVRAQQDRCRHIEAKRLSGRHIEHGLRQRCSLRCGGLGVRTQPLLLPRADRPAAALVPSTCYGAARITIELRNKHTLTGKHAAFRSYLCSQLGGDFLSQRLTSKGLCRRIHFRRMPSVNDGPSDMPDSGFAATSLLAGSPTSRITCSAASRSARSAASRSASTFSAASRFACAEASIFAILAASRFASLAASRSTLRAASRFAFSAASRFACLAASRSAFRAASRSAFSAALRFARSMASSLAFSAASRFARS